MPTYEYGCRACGHRFEEFQAMSDDPITQCPHCNENVAERLVSGGAGLIFKGSGFYITDYKNNEKSRQNESSKSSKSSGTQSGTPSGSESNSTTKPSTDTKDK